MRTRRNLLCIKGFCVQLSFCVQTAHNDLSLVRTLRAKRPLRTKDLLE